MDLTGQQIKKLRLGLQNGFLNVNNLNMFLIEELGPRRDINNYASLFDPLPHAAFRLIQHAEAEGWVDDLVVAALATRPKQRDIVELATELGLTGAGPNLTNDRPIAGAAAMTAGAQLESIVKGAERFVDMDEFLTKASVLQSQICRVETTNPKGNGTGFLVGSDLVLTNYHVMEPVFKNKMQAKDVVFRFDFRQTPDGDIVRSGTEFRAKADTWDVNHSPYSQKDLVADGGIPEADKLDYSLVRLADKAGEGKAGGSDDPNADDRGWITVNHDQSAGKAGEDVFLFQHPKGRQLKMAIGEHLGFNTASNRMRYDADTLKGSSGSPIFNANLYLIGLHHRGDPDADTVKMTAEHNQGIPISNIVSNMEAKGVDTFWEA